MNKNWKWQPEILNTLMQQSGVTRDNLADQTKLSIGSIHKYCRGEASPGIEALLILADFFAVPLDFLVGRLSAEEMDEILKDYHHQFMKLRRRDYEAFGFAGKRCPEFRKGEAEAPWPYNLLDDVVHSRWETVLVKSQQKALGEVLASLPERQRGVLLAFYRDGKSKEEIAQIYGVSYGRINEILKKGLRLLRHPMRYNRIKNGESLQRKKDEYNNLVKTYDNLCTEMEVRTRVLEEQRALLKIQEEGYAMTNMELRIEDLMLSARSYNCLFRAELFFVCEVVDCINRGGLLDIRNLGKVSADEIIHAVARCTGLDEESLRQKAYQ